MAAQDLLAAALRYADAGLRVIPVKPRGKLPLTEHGAHDATTDAPKIREWWQRWPDANIGMTLAGLVAVDIDPRNGGDAELLPAKLPETCYARTGGGGLHYLYRANGARYAGHPAQGIDVKTGPGAYIVVEPSVHPSGGTYCWLDETEPWTLAPANAPSWLAQIPEAAPPSNAEGKIAAGGRNAYLTSVAGSLRRKGTPPEALSGMLAVLNDTRCDPPLPEADVQRIAASVGRYAPAEEPPAQGAPRLEWRPDLDLRELAGREPEPPKFILGDWLPCGYATLIAGHGGVGKSGIVLHLALCIAAGVPFFGMHVERRRVRYLSCEDRSDILHWRLARICAHLGLDMASLHDWLRIVDLVGQDTVLWERDPRTGYTVTPAFGALTERMRGIELLVVDGISDTYAGSGGSKTEVKRYVNALVSLLSPELGAVLLVGHIDKKAAKDGAGTEGYDGTTGWHNAVRARWYLYPENSDAEDSAPERTGALILELQKSNFGNTNQEMRFRWDGSARMFLGEAIGTTKFDRKHLDRVESAATLRSLKAAGGVPAATTGRRTAYHVLAAHPEFPASLRDGSKASVRRFWRLIEGLRAMGHIREASIRRSDRHYVRTLELTDAGMRAMDEKT